MKKRITLLIASALVTVFTSSMLLTNTEPAIMLADNTQPYITEATQVQPFTEPQLFAMAEEQDEQEIDYSIKRIIVNTEIENIESMELDGLISATVFNDTAYLLEFYSEDDAQVANERFVEADIFSEVDIIVKAESDGIVYADNFKSWGVSATGMDDYQNYLKLGNNLPTIIVAVLDTGVDSSHPMLNGRVVSGWNFVNKNSNATDRHGHGTHVAGTIAESTLSNVKIMPVKVLNDNGAGYSSDVISGIRWAADNGAKVINLSLGGFGRLQSTRDAILYANSKGCVVVVSAGNDNSDASNYDPAWVPEAITVAAHNIRNQRASFSNYGNVIDLSAPGVDITSGVPGNNYRTWSGTSMSAPHISAAVALLMSDSQYNNLHPDAIQDKIKEATDDLGAPGFDIYYGHGGLNVKKLIPESNPPVTEPNPPVTEPQPPVSEPNPPVTEPKPPVSEPNPPVTEPKPPVSEPNPPVTEPKPPVSEPKPPVTEPVPPPLPTLRIGDIIQLGGYDWRVIDIQNGRALVISERVITTRQYHSNRKDDVTWENSDIRAWLNGEFYNNTFTAAEKTLIAQTRIDNANNQWFGTSGGNATTDRVFLLSLEEVVKYFGDSGQLYTKKSSPINDAYNSARTATFDGKNRWWWVRSPGNATNNAANINNNGFIDVSGDHVDNNNGGIRPALWITL